MVISKMRISVILMGMVLMSACTPGSQEEEIMDKMFGKIKTVEQAINVFPKKDAEIQERGKKIINLAQEQLTEILSLAHNKRTWENTAKALDDLEGAFSREVAAIEVMLYVHPDQNMRNAAQQEVVKLQEWAIDNFSNNIELYAAFKAYVDGNSKKERLNEEEVYYLSESMKAFKRAGLELSQEKRAYIADLKKKLSKLSVQFESNINTDKTVIKAVKEELAGIDNDTLQAFEKDDNGNYILKMDYPTQANIMAHCSISETRKRYSRAFNNRAYPANAKILNEMIELRDNLAHELGFESYAHLNIDDQMAKSPERVQEFLFHLITQSQDKYKKEFEQLLLELPENIELDSDGKINSWDYAYIKEQYRQKHFKLDDRLVAQYFPMEKTVQALCDIFQDFFQLKFKEIHGLKTWHEDVRVLEIFDKLGQLRAYLFLDLYPRSNKYTHAAHAGVVHAIRNKDGSIKTPGVSVLMANFPKSSGSKPSLLKHDDVTTFFHEFGHAMHSILGTTELNSFSGTQTKTDFVEMPSQMLEEWMYEPEILSKVSGHYQTGEILPLSLIEILQDIRKFDSGAFLTRQALLSQLSLDYFATGKSKDLDDIYRKLHEKINSHIAFDTQNHFYASFGHLTGYGAKYYGYMWSKVFALDLFEFILKSGLLNPAAGSRYKERVLSKGGSVDPNILLENFLGREPNDQAFIKRLGL